MSVAMTYWREPIMPWSVTENDRRFKKIARFTIAIFLIIGLVFPWLPTPEVEQRDLKDVAPRLAKLILEKQKLPPPKPKAKKPASQKKKIAKKKKVVKKKKPSARKKAERTGLMAMRDELADLRESFNLSSLQKQKPLNRKASQALRQRDSHILTAKASKGSGGINTRQLSNATGGGQLASRSTTGVRSNIGSGVNRSRRTASGKAARGEEEIELVFQRNKAGIFSLYNRALRRDPSLQGKVVLELTIAASGKVTKCRILSSELNNPALERKLISRVKLFRFASKPVASITVTYPIDFLPS